MVYVHAYIASKLLPVSAVAKVKLSLQVDVCNGESVLAATSMDFTVKRLFSCS